MRPRRGILAAAAALVVLAAPAVARANEVSHWNAIAQAETVPLRPTAHGQARGMAMVAGAMYDAVNAIDRGHQPYLVDFDEVGAPSWASMDAAAASAAYNVLLEITPVARHSSAVDSCTTTRWRCSEGGPTWMQARPPARPQPPR